MLYTAQKLLAFVFIPLPFIAHCHQDEEEHTHDVPLYNQATLVNGVWNDDYELVTTEHDSWKGWFIVNEGTSSIDDEQNKNMTTLSVSPIRGSNGQQYWGEFEQSDSEMIGPDNYFIRWFKCGFNTTSIIVEYYTAGCGQRSDDGNEQQITALYVDYYGDMNSGGNPKRDYVAILGKPEGGYNPLINEKEDGYRLMDEKMKRECTKGRGNRGRGYWVQRHGTQWIPKKDIVTRERVLPENRRFRTVIKIETGMDLRGRENRVLFYNFKMLCVHDEHLDSDKSGGAIAFWFDLMEKILTIVMMFGAVWVAVSCVKLWLRTRAVAQQRRNNVVGEPHEYADAGSDGVVAVNDINLSQEDLQGYAEGLSGGYDMRRIKVEDEGESTKKSVESDC